MGTYLQDNPPRIPQFRHPRRALPSGLIVVHTAESAPDEVGPDSGAENVARFIQNRTNYGSYHDLCDSDSIVHLVPYDAEAYGDGTGSNPYAYHVSAATQAHKWNEMSDEWRRKTVINMARASARYAKWVKSVHGVSVPPKIITKAQSSAREPGFISHALRDPDRRSDPGKDFPWGLYLSTYTGFMRVNEEKDMARTLTDDDVKAVGDYIMKRFGIDDPDNEDNRSLTGTLTEIQRDLNLVMDHLEIPNPH